MPHIDLTPLVLRLLEARTRGNAADFDRTLDDLAEAVGYVARPGHLRCAWCKRIIRARYIADPRGSDGICPECRNGLMRQVNGEALYFVRGRLVDELPEM